MGRVKVERPGGGAAYETWDIRSINGEASDPGGDWCGKLTQYIWLPEDFVPDPEACYQVYVRYSYCNSEGKLYPDGVDKIFFTGDLSFVGGRFFLPALTSIVSGCNGSGYYSCEISDPGVAGASLRIMMRAQGGGNTGADRITSFEGFVRKLPLER